MGRQRCRRVMRGTSYKIPGTVRALSRIASTHPTRMFESSLRSDWWIYLIQLNNKYLGNVYDRANYKIRNTSNQHWGWSSIYVRNTYTLMWIRRRFHSGVKKFCGHSFNFNGFLTKLWWNYLMKCRCMPKLRWLYDKRHYSWTARKIISEVRILSKFLLRG